jgi:DNA-binding response OmpR family regulator
MHTLLIEPNPEDRTKITRALHHAGQAVTAVATQKQALALLRDTPFDVIAFDGDLRGHMDLPALLRAFHWRWPHALVIVLTQPDRLADVVSTTSGWADGILVKPVDADRLRGAIQAAVQRTKRRTEPGPSGNNNQTLRPGEAIP